MVLTFTDSHLAISKKLGWDEMPAAVAIPAIDKILEQSGISDVDSVKFFTADELFVRLIFPIRNLTDVKEFISLRYEIEDEMRSGSSYQEAIHEWFK